MRGVSRRLISLICLPVFNFVAITACKTGETTEASELNIINGDEIPTTSPAYRNLVLIENTTGGKCTGSVIAEGLVLTAAHCTNIGYPTRSVDVTFEDAWLEESSRKNQYFDVNGMGHAIPSHQMDPWVDIAVIRIRPDEMPKEWKVVKLISNSNENIRKGLVAGYGINESGQSGAPRQASISNARLQKRTKSSPAAVIAFDNTEGGRSICFGDSGGPIYFQLDNQWQIGGVGAVLSSVASAFIDPEYDRESREGFKKSDKDGCLKHGLFAYYTYVAIAETWVKRMIDLFTLSAAEREKFRSALDTIMWVRGSKNFTIIDTADPRHQGKSDKIISIGDLIATADNPTIKADLRNAAKTLSDIKYFRFLDNASSTDEADGLASESDFEHMQTQLSEPPKSGYRERRR